MLCCCSQTDVSGAHVAGEPEEGDQGPGGDERRARVAGRHAAHRQDPRHVAQALLPLAQAARQLRE